MKDPGPITKELFLLIRLERDTMSFQMICTYVGIISIRNYVCPRKTENRIENSPEDRTPETQK